MVTRRGARHRRGQTMVEFALILPVLLLIIAGIIDFARAYMVVQVLTNAAMEGARVGILPGRTQAQVQAAVNQVLGTSSLTGVSVISGANPGTPPGTPVQVTVTTQFQYMLGTIIPDNLGVPASFPLSQTAVMRHE